jgi:hypothetical protein
MGAVPIYLIAWIVGGCLAIFFALVPDGSGWAAFDRLVQVTSALGSMGAVIVAVRLAGAQSRAAADERMERANLIASGIAGPLKAQYEKLRHLSLINDFNAIAPGSDLGVLQIGDMLYLRRQLWEVMTHPAFDLSEATLLALAPLPNHCATRLNAVAAEARRISEQLKPHPRPFKIPDQLKTATEHNDLIARLCWCVDMLSGPIEVLERSMVEHAPYPSREELLGATYTDDVRD